jgi:hypothetical protein
MVMFMYCGLYDFENENVHGRVQRIREHTNIHAAAGRFVVSGLQEAATKYLLQDAKELATT